MAKIYIFGQGKESFRSDDDRFAELMRTASAGFAVVMGIIVASISIAIGFFLGLFI